MGTRRGYLERLVLVLLVCAAFAAGSGAAGASHGAGEANYTVEVLGDPSPGATEVRYGLRVVGRSGADFETLTRTSATYEAGSRARCEATDGETFGVDRGATRGGYEIDETLQNNIKSVSSGEDDLVVEFNGDGDIGASTYLDDGDEVVSVTGCIDNPDEPGWYQITGTTSGVTADGEEATFRSVSHYFYICDCENEAAARRQLGPPPSEPETTTTPTPTSSGDADESTDAARETVTPRPAGEQTATRTRTATGPTPMSTAVASTTEAATTVESTPTEDTDSWDEAVYRSPTRAEGSGFGLPVALAGLLVAVFAVVRRR
jgi:hypothetical protein